MERPEDKDTGGSGRLLVLYPLPRLTWLTLLNRENAADPAALAKWLKGE